MGRVCLEHTLPPERAKSPEDLCLLHPWPLLPPGDKTQLYKDNLGPPPPFHCRATPTQALPLLFSLMKPGPAPAGSGGSDSAASQGLPARPQGTRLLNKWDFFRIFRNCLRRHNHPNCLCNSTPLGKSQQIGFPIYNCGQDLKNTTEGVAKIRDLVTVLAVCLQNGVQYFTLI